MATTATTTSRTIKSSRLPSAELPRDSRGLDILDRALYRLTKHVVAAVGSMRGESVYWETMLGGYMTGVVVSLNVDGTVSVRRDIYGGECILHWSKIPALVDAWEREIEAAKLDRMI